MYICIHTQLNTHTWNNRVLSYYLNICMNVWMCVDPNISGLPQWQILIVVINLQFMMNSGERWSVGWSKWPTAVHQGVHISRTELRTSQSTITLNKLQHLQQQSITVRKLSLEIMLPLQQHSLLTKILESCCYLLTVLNSGLLSVLFYAICFCSHYIINNSCWVLVSSCDRKLWSMTWSLN